MRRVLALVLALVLLPLSGCLGDTLAPAAVGDDDSGSAAPVYAQAVVAVIDTGANPYHEHFARPDGIPAPVLDTFVNTLDGAAPARVSLTQSGDHEARVKADEAVWAAMEPGVLYHFEGTRVLGISFAEKTDETHVVLDDAGHGSGTTGAVLDANPDAIVVLVEGISSDAEAWAAMQPWIDIVSMSYGPTGSVPRSGALFGLTTAEATRLMWDSGKLPVGAADNTPAFAPGDETAGPPWVLGVAGDNMTNGCREHVSGTAPDFTSDFTQTLPRHDSVDEKRAMSGTSFATPKTAGTLSLALQRVREAYGHAGGITAGALAVAPDGRAITNGDVREAFNLTAQYLPFNPTSCPDGPVNPAAPWLQQGWGHVGPEMADAAVLHLLGEAPAADKAQARTFQEALMESRRLIWRLE